MEEVLIRLTGRIQRLLGTLSLWRLKGLPPLKQTWNDQSRDHRFHGLARKVELHRFNFNTGKLPAGGARVADVVEEWQSIRASLPRACKKTSNVKPEDTPSNLPAEKMKPGKKPSDHQSAVARYFAESKDCAVAYSDTSFRVVRACPLSLNLENMEALYVLKSLTPNLCVQKSSIAHLQLFRHR